MNEVKQGALSDHPAVRIAAFALGCLGLVAVMAFDLTQLRSGVLREGAPEFSSIWLLRSGVILALVGTIVFSIVGLRLPRVEQHALIRDPLERLSILAGLGASGVFVYLLLHQAAVFSDLSRENAVVENASAVLLLAAAIATAVAVRKGVRPRVTQFGLALLALLFFLIAMEEISWGQHLFGFRTPGLLAGNEQDELNFHNWATNRIENIYYLGAFAFLVVVPCLRLQYPSLLGDERLDPLIAPPSLVLIGALVCAFNYDMWNIVFTQVAFYGSLLALLFLAVISKDRQDRTLVLMTMIVAIVTQGVFLSNGDRYERIWEVTEYKEFIIALGFFAFSLSTLVDAESSSA